MARRKVSLEQKAEVLAIYAGAGGNAMEAQRQTGFYHSTIDKWQAAMSVNAELARLTQEKKDALGVKFASLTDRILDRAHADLDQLSIKDRNFVSLLGVSAEKALLFAGEPTQIVERRTLSVELRVKAEAALEELATLCGSREQALADLQRVAPTLAQALGEQAPVEAGAVSPVGAGEVAGDG